MLNYCECWRVTVVNIKMIKLVDLDCSSSVQSRVKTDPETVEQYKEIWDTGKADFPPCIVYQDGEKYYVADGFHRIAGLTKSRIDRKLEYRTIACDVRQGTIRDAIEYSLTANSRHGLKPNTRDKKRSIFLYWRLSPTHCQHSNNLVSKACGTSHTFVGDYRADVLANLSSLEIAEQTGIPLNQIGNTILNLKLAEEAGEIITVRAGKELKQKVRAEPLQGEQLDLLPPISPKTLRKSYIFTNPNDCIPRGKIIWGFESLTDPGHISIEWDGKTLLILLSDAIKLPFDLGAIVSPIGEEIELVVDGYALVGTDLKVKSIDPFGFNHNHSSTELEPFIKKDDVEKSTPPILDLSILTTKQLHEIIATIGHEIHRRASLPQDIPDLAVC
jgi:hypothetical protein